MVMPRQHKIDIQIIHDRYKTIMHDHCIRLIVIFSRRIQRAVHHNDLPVRTGGRISLRNQLT